MRRVPEPEVMDSPREVEAYKSADFAEVDEAFARRALALGGPGGRAIDLGTGPAKIPILLCALSPRWRVVAVDASPEMLRAARKWVAAAGMAGRVELRRGDAKRLRRIRGSFDLVMSNSLLHHLPDPVPFWREVGRLAGRRGAVLVQDLARPESPRAARRLVQRHAGRDRKLLQELFYRSLLSAFTPAEVRAQLREARLRGLRVRVVSDRHLEVMRRRS